VADTSQTLGRYQLQRKIGSGAMGLVYEAFDPKLNRPVAIKTILKNLLDEEVSREYSVRFREEAQAVARLSHPNIVQVYDFGEEGEVAFIVMEFIRGKDLKHCFDTSVLFEARELVRMMCELLSALDYAHQAGIVHRDIKPANIMLDGQSRVKLMDFGVARITHSERTHHTQVGTMVGTPSYMSPEQVQGLEVDHRSDLFSSGIVLYQFLTNQRPFTGGDWTLRKMIVHEDPMRPSQVNAAISPEFDRVVSRALAKAPEARYQSASDFSRALQRVFEGKPAEDEEDGTVMRVYPAPAGAAAARPATPRPPAIQPAAPAQPAGGSQEVEVEFWRSIKDSDDPEDYDLYLQQFPQGPYARLAERKIAKLRRSAPDAPTGSGAHAGTGSGSYGVSDASTSSAEAEAQRHLAEVNRRQAEEQARRQAEARKQEEREAEERRAAEARVRQEAEARAKRESAEKLRRDAEEKARLEVERVKRENEEKARHEAEARAKRDAEEKARLEQERARREAEAKFKLEAEAKAKREAEEKVRREAEEKARREAEEKARLEQERVRREAEAKGKLEAEARAKREAEEKARREAEARLRLEQDRARREAESKAKLEAEAKARREAEEKARRDADEKARRGAEAKAKREAEEKARREAAERASRDTEARAKREAEEKARRQADRAWQDEAEQEAEARIAGRPEDLASQKAPQRRSPLVIPAIAAGALLVIGAAVALFVLRSPEEAPVTAPQVAKVDAQPATSPLQRAIPERPQEAVPSATPPNADDKAKRDAAEEAKEAEERARRERAEQQERERARLAEERKNQLEAARLGEEQKKREAARLAEERKKQLEVARFGEEQKKREAARLAEERKKQLEVARLGEEQKKREEKKGEAARLAEEEKNRATAKLAEEQNRAKGPELFQRAGELESQGKVSEAVKLYIAAANADHGPSAKRLGDIFSGGKGDVGQDYIASLRWHEKARRLGEKVQVKGR